MPPRQSWDRAQTLAAFYLYTELPFGQFHTHNPRIQALARWLGRTPGSVAMKLSNFASLDPDFRASGRAGLGNASRQDRELWEELRDSWDDLALEAERGYSALAALHGEPQAIEDAAQERRDLPDATLDETTYHTWVAARRLQGRFRQSVLRLYETTCCISGLQHPQLVIASHIVPWAEAVRHRLNPQNGLCLSALHDRAFDQGLLTVLPDYTVRVSERLRAEAQDDFSAQALLRFDRQPIRLPRHLRPRRDFLAAHAERFGFDRAS